jgi:ArsR family transcriptional regulator
LRYRADLSAMQSLMDFLTAHCCQGTPCDDERHLSCEPSRC